MKIIESTDNQNLGVEIDTLKVGDEIEFIGGFVFIVEGISIKDGLTVAYNANYQIVLGDE